MRAHLSFFANQFEVYTHAKKKTETLRHDKISSFMCAVRQARVGDVQCYRDHASIMHTCVQFL